MRKNRNESKLERRNLTTEFRVSAEGEQPVISGYAALFNISSDDLGGWTEQIDPHAFDSVINDDVRALWNHNPDSILGRTTANTLRLNIDARGLAYVIDPPDTQLAKDLIVSMRRKDITQSSFGFICKRDQWTENPDGTVTRRILEFDSLLDVSPVSYPAYSATTSQARSLPSTMPSELRSKLSQRDMNLEDGTDIEDGSDDDLETDSDELDQCDCACSQCVAGACGICSASEQCSYANRAVEMNSKVSDSEVRRMQMKLRLISK